MPYGDGVVTTRGTFQKFFDQSELKTYIEAELGTEAVPAEPGIYYVFREHAAREQFLSSRYRRRAAAPRKRRSEVLYDENRELLDAFMEALAEYGRLPDAEEWPQVSEVAERFGSLNRAHSLVRRITGDDDWDQIAQRRREDLLVFLALSRFRSRPPISHLPRTLQRDVKAFLGPYTKACAAADELLFRVGSADAIDTACKESPVGKLLPNALYVHRSALEHLSSILRVYEGCASAYAKAVDDDDSVIPIPIVVMLVVGAIAPFVRARLLPALPLPWSTLLDLLIAWCCGAGAVTYVVAIGAWGSDFAESFLSVLWHLGGFPGALIAKAKRLGEISTPSELPRAQGGRELSAQDGPQARERRLQLTEEANHDHRR